MRAFLPHLRLLTLEMDQISLLTEYLLPEEKVFLAGQLFFKEGKPSKPAPPSLSTKKSPRIKPFIKLNIIPESLITKEKKETSDVTTLTDEHLTRFKCFLNVDRDFILKGLEFLTQVNDSPDPSKNAKKAKYAFIFYISFKYLSLNSFPQN